jgi:hypothetical protein
LLLKVQLVRIQLRVPEYGWTTQKVFHFLNFLVNGGLYHFVPKNSDFIFILCILSIFILFLLSEILVLQFGHWFLCFVGRCRSYNQRFNFNLMVYVFFKVLICNPCRWICISDVKIVWACQLDCPTCLARYAKSCFLHDICAFGSFLGRDLLSG